MWIKIGITIFVFLLYTRVTHAQDENTSDQQTTIVKPVDLKSIEPSLFTEEEWYIPYYLKNFSLVANSVLESGEHKGFIDIVVWRTPQDNKPYNARIMESILSLVWFYTQKRPWNPYYDDPALRHKIETALLFWCKIQNDDGRFSEYAYQRWSLAPTAFAAKFVGRALYLLNEGPPIDSVILEKTRQAMRKALYVSFTNASLWQHGRNFTNQYANLWGGAFMYLAHYPDREIEELFHQRLKESMKEFQSSCGYFYEKNGPDWGYNLSTHHSDLHVAWHYARGTDVEHYFVEKTQKWYEWFSYNAVKEPGAEVYYLNKAVETRQQRWSIYTDSVENPSAARWTPQAEFVPEAWPFLLSQEEYASGCKRHFKRMVEQYPNIPDLRKGEFWSFSPYTFLHDQLRMWLPSSTQKEKAVQELPYLKRDNFTEVRYDNRNQTTYTFVRKPDYYVAFNSGRIITPQQRYGLGLIWNPVLGTIFQSQSNSNIGAWGTKVSGKESVYEAEDIMPNFQVDGKSWSPQEGKNLVQGTITVSYPLQSAGMKTILFNSQELKVSVRHRGEFEEVIPLMIDEDATVMINKNKIILKDHKSSMVITIKGADSIRRRSEILPTRSKKACHVLEIKSSEELEYKIEFN